MMMLMVDGQSDGSTQEKRNVMLQRYFMLETRTKLHFASGVLVLAYLVLMIQEQLDDCTRYFGHMHND